MVAVLRSRTLSEMRGFIKALIDRKATNSWDSWYFVVESGGIMASVQIAMLAGLHYPALSDTRYSHPYLRFLNR